MSLRDQIVPARKSKKPKQDTPGVGHNAAPALDAEQVKSFFSRWTRLEDERQATSDDLKELFAEAKGVRLSPKAMRVAFRHRRRLDQGKTPSREEQAELDLYLAALGALSDFVTKPSHAREAAPKPEAQKLPVIDSDGQPYPADEIPGDHPKPKPVMPDIPESLRRQQTDHAA